jgi:endogenous inhibitor of DNA gyrase (YacG/DUF329 family)
MSYVDAMTSPPLAPDKPCPICGKPSLDQFRPFCSRRCGDIDLHRWLSGTYAIPVRETDDDPDRPRPRDPEAE